MTRRKDVVDHVVREFLGQLVRVYSRRSQLGAVLLERLPAKLGAPTSEPAEARSRAELRDELLPFEAVPTIAHGAAKVVQ
jgi:hypothetical protein